MAITLTAANDRPSITTVKLTGIVIDVLQRTAQLHLSWGYMSDGNFVPVKAQPITIQNSDTEAAFDDLVAGVPEFKDLRGALEAYLTTKELVKGSVT